MKTINFSPPCWKITIILYHLINSILRACFLLFTVTNFVFTSFYVHHCSYKLAIWRQEIWRLDTLSFDWSHSRSLPATQLIQLLTLKVVRCSVSSCAVYRQPHLVYCIRIIVLHDRIVSRMGMVAIIPLA